ncbi:MAG: JAB domain-containing protein [Flavobacteriaceae bacterium]
MTQKTTKINTMHEVGIIYKRPLFKSMPHIKSQFDAYELIMKIIDKKTIDHKEFFWILLLNQSSRLLGYAEIGKGDTKGVIVNVKEIFQLAIKLNASSIILCHNHPSGNLEASKSDIELTKKVKKAGELFSISLIDHLIITSEYFTSFSEEGLV